jgi:hypothetical protein
MNTSEHILILQKHVDISRSTATASNLNCLAPSDAARTTVRNVRGRNENGNHKKWGQKVKAIIPGLQLIKHLAKKTYGGEGGLEI